MTDNTPAMQLEYEPISIEQLKRQINAIQRAMHECMERGTHYGKVPGSEKECLFKAGAEKICLLFRLVPSFEVSERDLGGGHREYSVKCVLRNISGRKVGYGVGLCSTMESKYRYRKSQSKENTGQPVPKEYWKARDPEIIGGKGFAALKDEAGMYMIFKVSAGEKVENPDLADTYNTCLKMGKKRAHVDAAITATAASDIFTQDLDETIPEAPTILVKAEPSKEPPHKEAPPQPELSMPYTYNVQGIEEKEWARAQKYLTDNGAKNIDIDLWISPKQLPKLDKYEVKSTSKTNSSAAEAA